MKEAIAAITAMSTAEIRAGIAFYNAIRDLNEDEQSVAMQVADGLVSKQGKERKPKTKAKAPTDKDK